VLCAWIALTLSGAGCEARDPLERARQLQDEQHDFAGSLELMRGLVAERPDDPEVEYRYGGALIATGSESLGMWPLRQASESPEWLLPAGLALARTAIVLGSWDEAISVCTRILDAHPDRVDALLLRADAGVRSRRHLESALADAERVLELEPDNQQALVPKTAALLALGRADEAAAALDELEAAHRDDSLGLHGSPALCAAQATFRAEKGDPEAAEERFEDCLKRFPNEPLVVNEAVSFFDAHGRPDRSEEILRGALEAMPDNFEYRSALFSRLRATGRAEDAEALLRAATELAAPASATVGWSALALYEIETGRFDEAAASFERARALDPSGSPDIVFGYADALVVAGRYDDALRVADSMSVPVHRLLVQGRVALARGNPKKALEIFGQANEMWPNNAVARYYTAVAAEQVGNFARAVEDYRYSMRIDVNATDAYLRLARLQRASGREQAALTSLEMQPGKRPSEDEAGLLRLELLAKAGRPAPPALLQYYATSETLRGAAVAALARGFEQQTGPEKAVEFLLAQQDFDYTDPDHADALRALVDAYAAAGKPVEGRKRVEAALRAKPEAAAFYALRGRALALVGAPPAEVRAAYERSLELDAEQSLALAALARMEAEAGASETALALYQRAASADPHDRDSVRAAAVLMAQLGRREEAEASLAALLREHPYDAEAALALAELRMERGAGVEGTRELARRAATFGGGSAAEALLKRLDSEHSSSG